jgi:hypothetical protein
MTIKSLIRSSIRRTLGYDIRRMNEVGRDPYYDMRKLTGARPSLVVFDVGANFGQTIESFQSTFLRPSSPASAFARADQYGVHSRHNDDVVEPDHGGEHGFLRTHEAVAAVQHTTGPSVALPAAS